MGIDDVDVPDPVSPDFSHEVRTKIPRSFLKFESIIKMKKCQNNFKQ